MGAAAPNPGYTFDGWFTQPDGGEEILPDTVVSQPTDYTVYAHWTPEVYEITLVTGDESLTVDPVEVTFGETYASLPEITRNGYDFLGWYLDGVLIEKTTMVTKVARTTAAPPIMAIIAPRESPLFTGAGA